MLLTIRLDGYGIISESVHSAFQEPFLVRKRFRYKLNNSPWMLSSTLLGIFG